MSELHWASSAVSVFKAALKEAEFQRKEYIRKQGANISHQCSETSFSIVLRSYYPYVPVPLSGPHFSEYLYFTVTEHCTVMLACKVTFGTNHFCCPSTSLELKPLCLLLRWQMWRRRHLSTGSKRMKRLFQKILPMYCQEPVLCPSPWYPYISYYLENRKFLTQQ